MKKIVSVIAMAAMLSACATKDFGRVESTGNLAAMSCAQLADEQAKIDQFRAKVAEKDDFDLRSLVAVTLLDFGYGNMRDKKKALRSAADREAQIKAAQAAQHCA